MENFDNATRQNIIDNKLVQVVFFMTYTVIFILGIFGNVLVCFVVFRNKAMQTVTNLFITNLALSDILLCVLAVPFTPLYTFLGKWVFGSVVCHLVPYAQGASVYISTLTLTAIAIDRFFVIIFPFRPRMKLSSCIIIIISIWLCSILVTLPYGVYMKLVIVKGITSNTKDNVYFCEEDWPSEGCRKIFSGLTTLMQFLVPFLVMKFCYICVSIRLNDRARTKPGSKNARKEEADRDRKKRTNRMLISMVAIFLVSWLPLNIINITSDFNKDMANWDYFFLSFFFVHALAMSSTCYNPFLYAWLNENFRKEFKIVLPFFERSHNALVIRDGNWKAERTCNGDNTQTRDTTTSSLLPSGIHRPVSMRRQGNHPPMKTVDSVEVENVMVPNVIIGVVYDSQADTVRLKHITEEEPPPYDTQQ